MTATDPVIDPQRLLSPAALKHLNQRSDWRGGRQLLTHLAVMGGSGWLWATQREQWAIALPALVIYGFSLAAMFAAVHECVHRTAFANEVINKWVGWLAGVLSGYNSTFYRRYHQWHHRYTKVPSKDPELEDCIPRTWGEYLWVMSGLPWWIGKCRSHWQIVTGQFEQMPYIAPAAYREIQRSTGLQLSLYAGAIALSFIIGRPWFWLYWVLPLAVGQPILRFILIAEHTGCPDGDDPLSNTRTTLTIWPIRLLVWNMPYHAEHHLYPSIPFHRLPQAHTHLVPHLQQVVPGYLQVNRQLMARLGSTSS